MSYNFPSSMDNNPPIPDFNQNPNPNFSYITHQTIRAGFTTNAELRNPEFEFPRNPIDVRGSLLRELEKERIRARLIAEEITQRRILEEEVRREMMFERELTHRFVPTMRVGPHRVPLMTNFERRGGFETVPFQRDPVLAAGSGNGAALHEIKEVKGVVASPSEGSKDKVIILAKPSANLADIKRKAMTPPVGSAIEVFKKQKTKEDWSCALCQITATSERGLHDHLQGKKHKTKERGMVSQRTGFDSGGTPLSSSPNTCKPVTPPTITSTPTVKKDEKVHNAPTPNPKDNHTVIDERGNGVARANATDKLKKKFRYFCEMCQAGAYSMKVLNAHKKGKKHLAKLSEVSKTNASTGVTESAPKAVMENNNKEVESTAGESKDGTKELVETGAGVDSDVNRVEGKVKVLEIIGGETVAPKITDQESVCSELVSKTEDAIRGEGSAQENIMEEIKEIEMAAEETKEETEEVETVRDVNSDENRVEDKEKVLERVGDEIVTPKSICQESVWNEGGITDDAVRVEESAQKALLVENKEVEMDSEETKEGIKGEEVEANVDDVDRDVKQIVYEEKVLEINDGETVAVAPKSTVEEQFCNEVGC
ncbi:uncharacterized protein LOC141597171 isoform X3 [Silene latifolia]|uniref:uncharacterized protein LOC141597171 isoform X3 n=1 Tax=Silene latifolia TaxID=37657 RepID=UPI003D7876C8